MKTMNCQLKILQKIVRAYIVEGSEKYYDLHFKYFIVKNLSPALKEKVNKY